MHLFRVNAIDKLYPIPTEHSNTEKKEDGNRNHVPSKNDEREACQH